MDWIPFKLGRTDAIMWWCCCCWQTKWTKWNRNKNAKCKRQQKKNLWNEFWLDAAEAGTLFNDILICDTINHGGAVVLPVYQLSYSRDFFHQLFFVTHADDNFSLQQQPQQKSKCKWKKKRKKKWRETEYNWIKILLLINEWARHAHITSTIWVCGAGDNVKRTLAHNDNLDDGCGLSWQHVKGQTMGASTMIKIRNEYYSYGRRRRKKPNIRTIHKTRLKKCVCQRIRVATCTHTHSEYWNSYQVEFSILLTEYSEQQQKPCALYVCVALYSFIKL